MEFRQHRFDEQRGLAEEELRLKAELSVGSIRNMHSD
jgi:hypothetical protein